MFISYEKEKNHFVISDGYFYLYRIKQLPNRRYIKGRKVWVAPNVRLNREELRTWKFAKFDKGVKEIIDSEKVNIQKDSFPNVFKPILPWYRYQKEALDYIYSIKSCALHMEMGLGKSKVSIERMTQLYIEGKIKRLLVICPASVVTEFIDQFSKHCIIEYSISDDLKKRPLNEDVFQIYMTSTEGLSREKGKAFQKTKDFISLGEVGVILDEAHYIKNSSSNRSKNICLLCRNVEYKIYMTGSPIEKDILSLYAYFQFLDPDVIGLDNIYAFKNRYMVYNGFYVIGYRNIDELFETVKPYIFQRTKIECLDLPEKVYLVNYIEMTPTQKRIYNKIKKERVIDMQKELTGEDSDRNIKYKHILSLRSALKQASAGFYTEKYLEDGEIKKKTKHIHTAEKNPKIKELKNIISGISSDEPMIIWAEYRQEIEDIKESLEGYQTSDFEKSYSLFIGMMTKSEKEENKQMFLAGKTRYFIATPAAGGTGLTLNNAAYVIYYTNPDSYLKRAQSEDRNHRIGQKRSVTYIDISVEGSLDSKIRNNLKEKKGFDEYVKQMLSENTIDRLVEEM